MKIEALDLADHARAAAELLLHRHPLVVFTSGRRDVQSQARAMAANVATNRKWIVRTYRPTAESAALQKWVDRNPQAVTPATIAAGLAGVMKDWTDEQKGRLSKHFSGEAFDVKPVGGPRGVSIKATIRTLPRLQRFLETEGGLVRWHAQFN